VRSPGALTLFFFFLLAFSELTFVFFGEGMAEAGRARGGDGTTDSSSGKGDPDAAVTGDILSFGDTVMFFNEHDQDNNVVVCRSLREGGREGGVLVYLFTFCVCRRTRATSTTRTRSTRSCTSARQTSMTLTCQTSRVLRFRSCLRSSTRCPSATPSARRRSKSFWPRSRRRSPYVVVLLV